MRPVKLSCGHRFCRGCWVSVLQSRDARAAASTTGAARCPFRCEVRPVVPEVEQALASELESRFDKQYTERATACALLEEERKAAEVNAWAAAGCQLDTREEPARLVEVAAAQRAQRVLRAMVTTLVVSGAGFLCLLGLVLLCVFAAQDIPLWSESPLTMVVLLGAATGLALLRRNHRMLHDRAPAHTSQHERIISSPDAQLYRLASALSFGKRSIVCLTQCWMKALRFVRQ